ncbi:MAG: GPR endopeptidase [Firmicutes bacterium]|nr:GPR endopeptidase [Bacillota bacterium]
MHRIDLKNYEIRTDLAIEATSNLNNIKKNEKIIDNIKVTNIYLDKKTHKLINKKIGNYTTIEFDDITDYNKKETVKKVFSSELRKLLKKLSIREDDSCLVIGLGNISSTPDALGPLTIQNILVTNHLFDVANVENGFRRVGAISPGVKGSTGIETSDIIKGIVDKVKPSFVIVIDALASQSIERVNKTIQMTDAGIHPGSGIGNNRKEISKETLDIPVIAIGVPTVVDAVTIVSDTINYMHKHFTYMKNNINKTNKLIPINKINYLKEQIDVTIEDKKNLLGMIGNLNESEIKQLIYEVLSPIGYNLMVTPKEINFVIDKLSDVIGNGINRALHKNVNNL